jgi:short-subunit dehydrogenase
VAGKTTAEGVKARFVTVGLSGPSGPDDVIQWAGPPDILVNNAGVSWFGPTAELGLAPLGVALCR